MTKVKLLLLAGFLSLASISAAHAGPSAAQQVELAHEMLSPEDMLVYKYLLAEIAGQRGDRTFSSQLFFNLAKKTRNARLAERATQTALYANQINLALKAATLWAEIDPGSVEAQQASSQMLIHSGDVQGAIPHLKKSLAKDSFRANGFLQINNLLANQEDKKAMYAIVKELAAPYPDSAEAHFALARAAWLAGDKTASKTAITQAGELRPGWEPAAQMHGQILGQESPEEAASFYKNFLDKHSNASDIRMSYAKVLVRLKRNKEAKPQFVKLIEEAKGNAEIHAVVGLLSYEADELDLAEKYLLQALENDFQDREQLYIYLGRNEGKRKNNKRAQKWFDQVHHSNKHHLEARLASADLIARTKNLDAAISMLDNVKELTAEQRLVVVQAQAAMLVQAKRHQDAYELIKKTVNSVPNTPQLIYDYAMAAERIGKLDEMESELRKVIKLQPDYAAAYNALGYSFADRNINLTEAKTLIETAVKLSPGDHYILDSLGWVEYRLGNYAAAIEHLQKAHNIQADPEISAHLGEVLWKQGRQEEAKKVWNSALKNFPENNVLVGTSKKFNN